MAGDWIKLEHVTPDKPEVVNMADILDIDQDAVVGKLVRIWIWADQNSVDGNALSVTDTFLDRLVFQVGFAKALRQVGWLSGKNGKLTLPQFERHNGETAKKRASTNRRVAKSRQKKVAEKEHVTDDGNTNVTLETLQKPLPEKRREEKSIESNDSIPPISPKGDRESIFPAGSLSKPLRDQKKIKVLRNLKLMQRIGSWFARKPNTLWTVAEANALKTIAPNKDEIALMESYYQSGSEILRRDLLTLLNNWQGELDRATQHQSTNHNDQSQQQRSCL